MAGGAVAVTRRGPQTGLGEASSALRANRPPLGEWLGDDAGGNQPIATPADAVEFARTRLGIEPDERQAEVLRSEAKRGMLNCTRQWGKSTIAAAKAVHRTYLLKRLKGISVQDRESGAGGESVA